MRAWYRKSGANGTGLCGKGFRAMGCRRGSFRPARRSLGRSGAVVGAAVRALRAESQGGVRWSLSAPWSLGVLEGRVRCWGCCAGFTGGESGRGTVEPVGAAESWRVGCGCRGCCADFTGGESGRGTVGTVGAVESWSLGGAGAVVGAAVRALRAESRCWRRRGRGEFFGAERFGPPVAPEGAWLLASKGGEQKGADCRFHASSVDLSS